MKKIYIVGIIIVLIVVGILIFAKKSGNGIQSDISAEIPIPEAEVKEFTVTGANFSFLPSTINVKKGDKVRIIFKNTQGFHDFVIDELNVASKQITEGNEDVLEFIADKTGTFEYYCSVMSHRSMGMVGKLIVE